MEISLHIINVEQLFCVQGESLKVPPILYHIGGLGPLSKARKMSKRYSLSKNAKLFIYGQQDLECKSLKEPAKQCYYAQN